MIAGLSPDSVAGTEASDTLYGNAGDDILVGGSEGDLLYGGQNNDSLSGGGGNDTLFGNLGNDTLIGGDGSDTFGLQLGGVARINDLLRGNDYLFLSEGLTFEDLVFQQGSESNTSEIYAQFPAEDTLRGGTGPLVTGSDGKSARNVLIGVVVGVQAENFSSDNFITTFESDTLAGTSP